MSSRNRKRSRGKAKGNNFEREICKQLGLWWTKGASDDIFWRSTTSGARANTRAKQGKSTYGQNGDITNVHPSGAPLIDLFTIELKRGYNATSMTDLMDHPNRHNQMMEFIRQARTDCKRAGAFAWWLIFKRDRRLPLVFMPWDAADLLDIQRFGTVLHAFKNPRHMLFVIRLEDLLRTVTPDTIKLLAREN